MDAKLTCCIIFALLSQPLFGQASSLTSPASGTSSSGGVVAFVSDYQPNPSIVAGTPVLPSPAPVPSMGSMLGCDDSCDSCPDCEIPCCGCTLGLAVYGGSIYWRPRDADVAFAAPIDGPIVDGGDANPIFVGPVAVADPDFEPGFFAGFQWGLDCGSFLDVRYTMLETNTNGLTQTGAPQVIRSLVAHPSTNSAATDFLRAEARLSIDLDYLDASYRHLFHAGPKHAVHYFVGSRYARLDQRFTSLFTNNGTETVQTDLDFDGAGIMLGLDAVRFCCCHGFNFYANTSASFVAGRFRGNYFQGTNSDPIIVDTQWEAGRIVPILDLELGVGWTSKKGHFSVGAGYMVGAWFNTPNTEDFIHAVQYGDFSDTDAALSFDGLTAHAELRW